MKYKLIAIDMDGTLLNSNNEVSDRTRQALKRAMEQGVHVVLATGRLLKSALLYAENLELNNYIVACNGAVIADEFNDIVYKRYIDKNTAVEVMKLAKECGIYYHFYNEYDFYSNIYVEEVVNFYNSSASMFGKPGININIFDKVDDILNNHDINVYKFMFIDDNMNKLSNFKKELNRFNDISMSTSWRNNLEIMSKEVSKGNGIKYLCEKLGIIPEEVITIGDNENDLSMISFAGLGVAMGNGEDIVKKNAKYITATNNEDGVAKVIEKFILETGDEN